MLGMCVMILAIGLAVVENNSNPVILLEQYAPLLYKWNCWTTIVDQVIMFTISWIVFICSFCVKDQPKSKYLSQLWMYACIAGSMSLIQGFANILATKLLIKSLAGHPETFNKIDFDLLTISLLVYSVAIWFTMKLWQIKIPKRDME